MTLAPTAVSERPASALERVVERLRTSGLVSASAVVLAVVFVLGLTGHESAAQKLGSGYALAVAAYVAVGMVRDLLHGTWGIDVLAVTAIVSTVAVGEYLAAMVVVVMLTGGEALEAYAADRAGRELGALLERAPQWAHRLSATTDAIEDLPVDQVGPGDALLVHPSEVVPVDGVLLTDEAAFDESSLTGESLPVTRVAGDVVLSGSVNGGAAVQMRATAAAGESRYQRIVALVAEAQERRAPMVRMADRYAVPFTAVSLLIAALAWWWSGDAGRFGAVLVLATPCPLLIAAPVSFLAGMGQASRNGIVVRGGDVLERLARVRTVAFDKTGTLTEGRPALVEVRPQAPHTEQEVLRLAASAEQYSSHVLAHSVIEAAEASGLVLERADWAEEQATHGVSAQLPSGDVVIGKRSYVAQHAGPIPATALGSGELAVYVAVGGSYAGALVLRDTVRPDAVETLQRLTRLGVQDTMMLTGDAQQTAEDVAATLGITTVIAECLPEDKVRAVQEHRPGPVMMVGDGVNDAPVLASADVGVAMGARAATAASESADVVLLTDNLVRVADAVRIGQRTRDIARQSIWIGIGLSVVLMLVAAFGFIPAVLGALLQELVDLASIGNSLRARGPGRRNVAAASQAGRAV